MNALHDINERLAYLRLSNKSAIEKRRERCLLLSRAIGLMRGAFPIRRQRDTLNRRQFKAHLQGVKVYRDSIVCGMPYFVRKW